MDSFFARAGLLLVIVSMAIIPYTEGGFGMTLMLILFGVGVLMFLFPGKGDG